jgi:acyl-CoA synthetase (AMP-forming)/AMP-acid ligase II
MTAKRKYSAALFSARAIAAIDPDGYFTYVGRADDVFKASDYRISPFELESVLIEHPALAEAAIIPSPDPLRLAVPQGFCRAFREPDSRPRHGPVDLLPFARPSFSLQARAPPRIRRFAEDDFGQDPPRRVARRRSRPPQRRQPRRPGILGGRFPGAAVTEKSDPRLSSDRSHQCRGTEDTDLRVSRLPADARQLGPAANLVAAITAFGMFAVYTHGIGTAFIR